MFQNPKYLPKASRVWTSKAGMEPKIASELTELRTKFNPDAEMEKIVKKFELDSEN